MYRKVPWKSNESDANLKPDYPQVFVVASILAERCMYVRTWENSETVYQIRTLNQANQNDWPKENWKNWPIKVIQIATSVWLSLSLSLSLRAYPCVYPLVLYSFSY